LAGTAAFARFGDYDPILRAFLAKDDVASWIAEVEGVAAGFALVERPPLLPGFADLVAIAVVPAHRRHGLASALLGTVIDDAERRGEALLALTVAEDNAAAISLFSRFGFRMIAGSVGHYAGGQRSRRMVRHGGMPPHEIPETR
jgi:ribosomal-protein-alanine N-acetyltransferase